jgi:Tfp pilus assembly protein PilF
VFKAQLLIIKLRFEEAETYFKKAIQVAPDNINNIIAFANFHYKQNQFNKARPW